MPTSFMFFASLSRSSSSRALARQAPPTTNVAAIATEAHLTRNRVMRFSFSMFVGNWPGPPCSGVRDVWRVDERQVKARGVSNPRADPTRVDQTIGGLRGGICWPNLESHLPEAQRVHDHRHGAEAHRRA